MKMSPALFAELKADMNTVRNAFIAKGEITAEADLTLKRWNLFHAVAFDRMSDDNHPAYVNRLRLLPFWSRNGETRDTQGNDHWQNRFYVEEDLNDSHIDTALRKIVREWGA